MECVQVHRWQMMLQDPTAEHPVGVKLLHYLPAPMSSNYQHPEVSDSPSALQRLG
jgi:hypothetical protein